MLNVQHPICEGVTFTLTLPEDSAGFAEMWRREYVSLWMLCELVVCLKDHGGDVLDDIAVLPQILVVATTEPPA